MHCSKCDSELELEYRVAWDNTESRFYVCPKCGWEWEDVGRIDLGDPEYLEER